jgi:hypothetical protein
LKHPELVTEGMNRLAQALMAILSSAPPAPLPPPAVTPGSATKKKRKPRSRPEIGLAPQELPAQRAPQTVIPWEEVNLLPEQPVVEITPQRESSVAEPVILDAVPLQAQPVVADPPPADSAPSLAPVKYLGPVALPEGLAYQAENRRERYRRLVSLRRAQALGTRLATTLGTPGEPFQSAERIYDLLQGTHEWRKLKMRDPAVVPPDGPGHLIRTILEHPTPLAILRDLTPTQRRAVAVDWAKARATWEAEYEALRESTRQTIPRNPGLPYIRDLARLFQQNPEWVLVLLIGMMILLASLKMILRGPTSA